MIGYSCCLWHSHLCPCLHLLLSMLLLVLPLFLLEAMVIESNPRSSSTCRDQLTWMIRQWPIRNSMSLPFGMILLLTLSKQIVQVTDGCRWQTMLSSLLLSLQPPSRRSATLAWGRREATCACQWCYATILVWWVVRETDEVFVLISLSSHILPSSSPAGCIVT